MLTNELGLPQPFVDAATSDHKYAPRRYSVTDLLGGTCEAVLKRRHEGEQEEDVSDRVWAILGSAVHKVLEQAEPRPHHFREWLMKVDIPDGYELSGITDLYDADAGTVTDWKTCSVWKAQFGDYSDWQRQTLLYCWMLRQQGIPAHRGEVVAIMRDHSMRKARFEPDYPKHPVLLVGWEFADEDMEAAGWYVDDWFAEVREQEALPDEKLVPCSDEQVWHKPDTWAVMRDGRKRAIRVFEDEEEAVGLLNRLKEQDKGHHIEFRKGEDTRCMSYCPVARWCPRGKVSQNFEDSR